MSSITFDNVVTFDNLMDAYNAILDILGERNKTDLSKEIFSRFCVGK